MRPARGDRDERRALAIAVAAPLVVGAIVAASLWRDHWTPVGDWAAMWLRADDVFTIHTPLVGVYSTRGWSHPGPSIFWVVWALKQLSLHSVPRAFALMALVNAATISVTVVAARRWFGLQTALVTGLVGTVLCHALGGTSLGDFWNPYPPVVWFFAFAIGLGALVAGSRRGAATWSAVFGTLAAQAHMAFTVLVAFLAVAALLYGWRQRRLKLRHGRRPWMWVLIALWLPVFIDLVAVRHNGTRIWDYFGGRSKARPAGSRVGIGLVARELAPWGPLVRGGQLHYLGGVLGAPLWWLWVPAIAIAALLIGPFRAAQPDRARIATAVLFIVLLWVSAARLEGYVFDYLVTFMVSGAAVIWWVLLAAGTARPSFPPVVAKGISVALVVGIVAVVAVSAITDPARANLPAQSYGPIALATAERISAHLGSTNAPVVIDYLDDPIGVVGAGVIANLAPRYDVRTLDAARLVKWGYRRSRVPRNTRLTYTLVFMYNGGDLAPANRCVMHYGGKPVIDEELLGRASRRQLAALRIQNYLVNGRLDPATEARYTSLRSRATRVLVYPGLYRDLCGP